jgi:hypothetical protein
MVTDFTKARELFKRFEEMDAEAIEELDRIEVVTAAMGTRLEQWLQDDVQETLVAEFLSSIPGWPYNARYNALAMLYVQEERHRIRAETLLILSVDQMRRTID